jgi:hypothetical protein
MKSTRTALMKSARTALFTYVQPRGRLVRTMRAKGRCWFFDLVDTWNDGGVAFDALKMDVTDTASNAESNLLKLAKGGITKVRIRKDGAGIFQGALSAANLSGSNTGDQTITLTGDVTGSGTGSFSATIANDAVTTAKLLDGNVTLAKLANLSAQYSLVGRSSSGAGVPEQITSSADVFTILGSSNFAAIRSALSLGSAALSSASDFDAAGAATAAQAASQPLAANLTSWAALAPAAKQDASANLSAWSALAPSTKQDQSANLDAWSAIATSVKQAAHANLTIIAGLASVSNLSTLAGLSSITPLTRLAASGETVTTSNPILDLAQTWNAGAVTFTGLRFNATDTASASSSILLDLQVGGVSKLYVKKDGSITSSGYFNSGNYYLGNNSGSYYLGGANDVILTRDAANTLAQRNGANAQTIRIYNTYTDASNYERAEIGWTSNSFIINTGKLGTGQTRVLQFAINGTNVSYFSASGHLLWNSDNTYDIGASGATRPRDGFFGQDVTVSRSVRWASQSRINSSSDGVLCLLNNAAADFSRLQFGGTTSSFPALKRSAAGLQVRLADDSGMSSFECSSVDANGNIRAIGGNITAQSSLAIPAGGTTGSGLKVSSTANFGVFFGSGAPTLSAAKGSLYLRSDGSTTNDRMYVNPDGGTTWTAVTTAA